MMTSDVVDLHGFYASGLGQMARRALRRRIRQMWPNLAGETVLGLGYATPVLGQFLGEAQRTFALSQSRARPPGSSISSSLTVASLPPSGCSSPQCCARNIASLIRTTTSR